ncbi:MAG: endonuclease I [Chitinophagaceae bacterium]|nr:endonuclease I [Chitinophagaceae bacterium]
MPRKRHRPMHRSSFEDKVIAELTSQKVSYTYESIKLRYVPKPRIYTPDIVLHNGIVVELKGYFDQEDRTKMLLIKEQYPQLDIRMVFQKASKPISKGSKTTYAIWCDKHGILWAEGSIPMEWITERKVNETT